ncbi:hypothetical protein [Nocardia alni]|uniref:hypothetical protein n=1 Tax=Nocardia alni TaxID=2815723 RepID=UPI001C23D146|nr:hypothetical protein [Nocardia alni]
MLVVKTNHAHPSNWMNASAVPVLPADVAESIHIALTQGWTPSTPGSPFILDRSENFTPSHPQQP